MVFSLNKVEKVELNGKVRSIYSSNPEKPNTYDILLWLGMNYNNSSTTRFVISGYEHCIINVSVLHAHSVYLDTEADIASISLGETEGEKCVAVPFSMCIKNGNVLDADEIYSKVTRLCKSDNDIWLVYDDVEASNEIAFRLYSVLQDHSPEICFAFPDKFIRSLARDDTAINLTELESTIPNGILEPVRYEDVYNVLSVIDSKYKANPAESKFIDGSAVASSPTARVKELYAICILNYNVYPFTRLHGFLDDLLETKLMYPIDKMSLYERIMFMRRMPRSIGFISRGYKKVLAVKVDGIVYDRQYAKLYDWDTCEEVPNFEFVTTRMYAGEEETQLVDPRELFSSEGFFQPNDSVENTKELWEHRDFKVNLECVAKFRRMNINAPISFKNSVLVKYRGRLCLAYFPHKFTLFGSVISPLLGGYTMKQGLIPANQIELFNDPLQTYEGGYRIEIDEDEFHSIVDVRLALAQFDVESIHNSSDRLKHSLDIFNRLAQMPRLEPALPLDLTLMCDFCTPSQSKLSVYDLMLRTMGNVLPVNKDDAGNFKHSLIDEISLEVIEESFMTKNYITCFGTLVNMGEPMILPITYSELKGRKIT